MWGYGRVFKEKIMVDVTQADENGEQYTQWNSPSSPDHFQGIINFVLNEGGLDSVKTLLKEGKCSFKDEDGHTITVTIEEGVMDKWPSHQKLASFWATYPGSQEDYIKAVLWSE